MNELLWAPLAIALLSAMGTTAHTSSTRTTESAGEYNDGAAITSKDSAVLLGGFVNAAHLTARAGEVAWGVFGVASPDNSSLLK